MGCCASKDPPDGAGERSERPPADSGAGGGAGAGAGAGSSAPVPPSGKPAQAPAHAPQPHHPAHYPPGHQQTHSRSAPSRDSTSGGGGAAAHGPPHPHHAPHPGMPARPSLEMADKVEARWKGGDPFPGWVVSVCGGGVYRVLFEDGDADFVHERDVVRRYADGDRVDARWKGGDYYRGWVAGPAQHPGGTYPVHYDDGGFEPEEPLQDIRMAHNPSPVSKGQLPPPGGLPMYPKHQQQPQQQQPRQQARHPGHDRRS